MPNLVPTKTCYQKGRVRLKEEIEKQRDTMRFMYELGLRKSHPNFISRSREKKPYPYKPVNCEHCGKEFRRKSARQQWCEECAPNKSARRILSRYGVSPIEHKYLLDTNKGLCFICLKRKAKVVDHCHRTGRVRGLLCHHCNTSLNLIENKDALARAIKYVSIS
jgi:hypothetical protein